MFRLIDDLGKLLFVRTYGRNLSIQSLICGKGEKKDTHKKKYMKKVKAVAAAAAVDSLISFVSIHVLEIWRPMYLYDLSLHLLHTVGVKFFFPRKISFTEPNCKRRLRKRSRNRNELRRFTGAPLYLRM